MSEKSPLFKSGSGDTPWQLRFAYVFGVPAVIAVYLIWFFTTRIDSRISNIHDDLRDVKVSEREHKEFLQLRNRKINLLQNTLTRICANTAQTPADRNSCFKQGNDDARDNDDSR